MFRLYRLARRLGISYHAKEGDGNGQSWIVVTWPMFVWSKPSFIIKLTNGFCVLGGRSKIVFITKTYIKYQNNSEIVWCLHMWQIVDNFWKMLRRFGVRRPFKGCNAYEWQIFMMVFQAFYPGNIVRNTKWRVGIWYDRDWLHQSFLHSCFKNYTRR